MTKPRVTKERLRELHKEAVALAHDYGAGQRTRPWIYNEWQAAEAAFQAALEEVEVR